jgi:hypothetical protein
MESQVEEEPREAEPEPSRLREAEEPLEPKRKQEVAQEPAVFLLPGA